MADNRRMDDDTAIAAPRTMANVLTIKKRRILLLVLLRPHRPLVHQPRPGSSLIGQATEHIPQLTKPTDQDWHVGVYCNDYLYIAPAAGAPPTEIGSIGAPRYVDQQQPA
jgi:hypothetical protein